MIGGVTSRVVACRTDAVHPQHLAGSGADGNGYGIKGPNNIFDTALATAAYLCRGVPGSDLTSDADQRRAAFSYSHSSA